MTNQEINEAVGEKLNYDCKCDEYPCACRPDYCGDIRAAWEIADKGFIGSLIHLESGRWFANCGYHADGNSYYEVGIYEGAECVGVIADTAPMAICLAFLKLP